MGKSLFSLFLLLAHHMVMWGIPDKRETISIHTGLNKYESAEILKHIMSDSCKVKLDSFIFLYNSYVRPSAQKMVEYKRSNKAAKADSIQTEITAFYEKMKTEMMSVCETTRLDYIKKFYTPYLGFNFTGWPAKRKQLFSEMEYLIMSSKEKNQDSTFLEVINRKAVYHLRINEYSKMKASLEEGIQFAKDKEENFFHYLFVLRLNYSLYFMMMNLPDEALRQSLLNDEMVTRYGIQDKSLFIRNLNYIADAYSMLNDEVKLLNSLERIKNYCKEQNFPEKDECDLQEHLFTLAMKKKQYQKADSILQSGLLSKIRDDSYDSKLRLILLYSEMGKHVDAELIAKQLSKTFEVYNLEGIHLYRLSLLNARLDLAVKSQDLVVISEILDEMEYAFLANIYNVFNEDPHLQYSILSPMQMTAWNVLKRLSDIEDKRIIQKVYTLNTNIKKLNPVFLEKRSEIMSGYANDDLIHHHRSRLQELSSRFSVIQKSDIKDTKLRTEVMDSIRILEKLIQSGLIQDLKFEIPNITVETIQSVLAPDQLFIEFFEVNDKLKQKSDLYAVCIDENEIKCMLLPELKLNIHSNTNFTNNKLENKNWYDYFFTSLSAKLDGKNEVLVVGDGIVHQIPLEVLSPDGTRKNSLMEKHRFRYYNSSKSFYEEMQKSKRDQNLNGTVFAMGGIRYNCLSGTEKPEILAFRGNNDTLAYLPGSLVEVDKIREEIGPSVKVITGCDATKNSLLQAIQDTSYKAVHISTHGVIYKNQAKEAFKNYWYLETGNVAFLALANQPEGFVSAFEITNLDARHVNLVYLSACSSGIGPYISGQGLFSIGDAFASAGAEKVLYTLWDIPDASAVEFAGRFYEHLHAGSGISQAFEKTRKSMSGQFPPSLWAAFRLLE